MLDKNARRATLIASLTSPLAEADLPALPPEVDWLEVRADLIGEPDLGWLHAATGKKILYTLRSRAEGGAGLEEGGERRRRLAAAARAGYDAIDLEAARDLDGELLGLIPKERRILSWHGGVTELPALAHVAREMLRVPALLHKLVPAAERSGDEVVPLLLLAELDRRDVAAFATGACGSWTRLLAPRLGAPVVYGAFGAQPAAPGQPTLAKLITDFGLPDLPPVERLFGIVGAPVEHSLSPRLHNGCYRALGIPALYLPFHADSFADFWLEVVEEGIPERLGFPLAGLSVTAPFKEAGLTVAAAASPLARAIGAANTLVRRAEGWEADATDPAGVVAPLRALLGDLRGLPVAVLGAGGAGRSAAVGLGQAGARVTLANRTIEVGQRAARELGLPFVPLAELDPAGFRIAVNATSLGRADRDALPIDLAALAPDAVVVDLVYGSRPTRLIEQARVRGLAALDGREVLLAQAAPQFELMTGERFPAELGRRLLELPEGR